MPFRVLGFEGNDVLVDNVNLLAGVQVLHVVQQAVVVLVHHGAVLSGDFTFGGHGVEVEVLVGVRVRRCGALVRERDAQALVQEGHLLEAGAERLEIELRAFEDAGIRVEGLGGAGRGPSLRP